MFGVAGLWGMHPKEWLKQKWWLLGVVWVSILALSYFWSSNKADWAYRMEIKMPFLLLPLAFSLLPAFSLNQLRGFTVAICSLLLISAIYSASFLASNFNDLIYGYKVSKVLPTLAENDHIRFSLCILLTIIWCAYFWPRLEGKIMKGFVAITMVVLSVYLHVLAARTGLMLWYLFIIAYTVFYVSRRNKALAIAVFIVLIVMALVAIEYVPTLRNRVGYFNYMYILFRQGEISAIYSDMNRMISYEISSRVIAAHPLAGVGLGDMMTAMAKGYDKYYPGTDNDLKILPHNQFLVMGLAVGIPALLLFVTWVFAPLRYVRRNRDSFFFAMVWLVLLLPLLVEPMLEIQFGVFVYLFFLLWQRHILLKGITGQQKQA